ncbi:hypothetical protein HPB52_008673 [Rhipicephalus sanguineus]|uniref:Uncharacterized protein n=1 Tax=Rhipicephalus sanguineus TaxID=34632 RepID=A0A9D4QFB3_RHISA|nr:hypothetical protein HPB52_008673 [Rhipicephalus sanguineus]
MLYDVPVSRSLQVDLSAIGLHDPAKQEERRERREAMRAFVTDTTFITVAIIVFLVVASALAWRQVTQDAHELSKCTTAECAKFAGLIANAIDETKKACDNYYLHVCGAENMRLKDASSTNEKIRIAAFELERTKLLAMKVPENAQTPLEKAAAYLQACESVVNTSSVDEVRKALREGGITWPDYPDPSTNLIDQVFYMSAKLYTGVFFRVELNISVDGTERPVVGLSLDADYLFVLKMLAKHRTTKRILGHFQLTYATFAPTGAMANDKKRLQELFDDLIEVGRHFANTTTEEAALDDSETLVLQPRDLPTAAPHTDYKAWDAALRRYFNETFDNVGSVTIGRPKYFKTIFWALAKYGSPKLLDVFGWVCVQSLALAAHQRRCIVQTYSAFRFAINVDQWMHVPEDTLKDITDMANQVWRALGTILSDDRRTILGSRVPPPKDAYLASIFKHRSISKPDRLAAFYAVVPALTKKPLYDYVTVKSSLAAHLRDPEFQDMIWARHLEITGRIQGYSLLPRELKFPWFEPGAPYAVALAGLGVRMAATLYFQMLAKNPNANKTNEANFRQAE